jgi:hypothetical protein
LGLTILEAYSPQDLDLVLAAELFAFPVHANRRFEDVKQLPGHQ